MDMEDISWKLYEGEMLGFSIRKIRPISRHEIKTTFGIYIGPGRTPESIIKMHARKISREINKPIIIVKVEKHRKEECYKIIFPEGGSIGCEALVKKSEMYG